MGADIHVEGNLEVVRGVEHLTGAQVMSTDLRASAGLGGIGCAAGKKLWSLTSTTSIAAMKKWSRNCAPVVPVLNGSRPCTLYSPAESVPFIIYVRSLEE